MDQRKHDAIVRAGHRVFLARGFDRTKMSDVAAAAKVSKQTLYNHYKDKEALFLDVIARAQAAVADPADAFSGDDSDVEDGLKRAGRAMLVAALDPDVSALRRVVNAEIVHHPKLRAAWSAGKPVLFLQRLVEFLERADARGALAIDSPVRAASQLMALIGSEAQTTSSFGTVKLRDAEVEDIVDANVAMFLRAYAAPRLKRGAGR